MNWVKENKFLTGFIVVMLIGLGALGFEVYAANSAYDEATDKYTHDAGEYNRLRHLVPFPNKQNLEAYDVQKEEAAKVITDFEAELSKKEFPLEPISPNNFQDQLKASVTAIRAKAQENGTKLPEKFYLGFDKYETTPSSNEAAAPLSRELKAIEWVMQQYLAHPSTQVRDITALARMDLPEERERTGRGAGSGGQSGASGGPGGRPTGGGPGGRGPGGAPGGGSGRRGGLVQYHPFDVTVVCKQQALMEVLNTITGPKAPQFIVLAQIRIRNSTEKGPPRVGPDAAKPDEKQTVNYIVGEEWIEVLARWEIVDFANPAEKSAAEQPVPASGAGPGSKSAPAPAAAAAPKATPAPAAAPAPEGTLTPNAITTPATTLIPTATPAPAATPVPAAPPASAPAPK